MKHIKEEYIKEIIDNAEIEVTTMFDKTTVVAAKFPNGFVLVESSSCMDQKEYSEEIGAEICMSKIEDRLWELEGYFQTSMQHLINVYEYAKGDKESCK